MFVFLKFRNLSTFRPRHAAHSRRTLQSLAELRSSFTKALFTVKNTTCLRTLSPQDIARARRALEFGGNSAPTRSPSRNLLTPAPQSAPSPPHRARRAFPHGACAAAGGPRAFSVHALHSCVPKIAASCFSVAALRGEAEYTLSPHQPAEAAQPCTAAQPCAGELALGYVIYLTSLPFGSRNCLRALASILFSLSLPVCLHAAANPCERVAHPHEEDAARPAGMERCVQQRGRGCDACACGAGNLQIAPRMEEACFWW
mmetsp:Transcript_46960/g.101996  ORF Transcript_46960/g.101996 Transcript_46960/m.101996 type:complete len:258 (-) Transcript_46960:961-1734(-)